MNKTFSMEIFQRMPFREKGLAGILSCLFPSSQWLLLAQPLFNFKGRFQSGTRLTALWQCSFLLSLIFFLIALSYLPTYLLNVSKDHSNYSCLRFEKVFTLFYYNRNYINRHIHMTSKNDFWIQSNTCNKLSGFKK